MLLVVCASVRCAAAPGVAVHRAAVRYITVCRGVAVVGLPHGCIRRVVLHVCCPPRRSPLSAVYRLWSVQRAEDCRRTTVWSVVAACRVALLHCVCLGVRRVVRIAPLPPPVPVRTEPSPQSSMSAV
jgi:hypothetical protein